MIEKLQNIIAGAKFLTLTLSEHGDGVLITASVHSKDGKEQTHPLQIQTDWQIADAMLLDALNRPPKPGKAEPRKTTEEEQTADLFGAGE